MFFKTISAIIAVSVFLLGVDTADILAYFPVPSISHHFVFRHLTQELAKKDHPITIITTDPAFKDGITPPNITEIDVHNKSYELWRDSFVKSIDGALDNPTVLLAKALKTLVDITEYQINTDQVSYIIETKQFDLILAEACVEGALIMSHIFEAPTILVSSFGSLIFNNEAVGIPSQPFYFSDPIRKRIYNISAWEKIFKIKEEYEQRKKMWYLEKYRNAMFERNYRRGAPISGDIHYHTKMLILNTYPIWHANRPVPPSVIYIGGLHQQPIRELPNNLKKYLDISKHGVIYMSFGTNVETSQLSSERIQIFCNVFSRLKYDVLWKWNGDELPKRPQNVRISKWLPQSDLLKHPKVKLFITQAGLQSTDESISAGIPLIAFPMAGDQWYNAEKYVHYNIGHKMDFKDVTEESLEEAINKVIDKPSYRNNVKRLGVLMRDQPQSPLERAVWWTEYVLRHGGATHLRSPAANISWTEYLVLDMMTVLFVVLILVIAFLVLIIFLITKFIKTLFVTKPKFMLS